MGYGRSSRRKDFGDEYSRGQIQAILAAIGVRVTGETHAVFTCYCPFHGNKDTFSFAVNVENGSYICFNPACGEDGSLVNLVKAMTGRNDFEALRFIKSKEEDGLALANDRLLAAGTPFEWTPWKPEVLARLRESFPGSPGETYMVKDRGFTIDTLDTFEVGYSAAKNMVAVPLHSPNGIPVGIIGRSLEGKGFKNSIDLPRSKTLFNLNRAKRVGDIAVITESSFDAMRVHQAGYPNSLGTLGGYISEENINHLDRHFSTIIIMTDFDIKSEHVNKKCRIHGVGKCPGHNPGRELGLQIANGLRTKNILWAVTDYKIVYPHGAKDAGDLSDAEIAHCIENAVTNFEYLSWGVDFQ